MPVITIEFFPGRSEEIKQNIAEKITDLMLDVAKQALAKECMSSSERHRQNAGQSAGSWNH